ncbi:DNA mismatch repair protein MutS, partial [Bacillus inaquosorum]|uniref:MutS-related protein n=1 Tax=Bacillus inaquosorum TaxID=483913 RepID=UPI0022957492|nr:DNA mismatch repair protein MutS [Bacillus inaquosorum]
PLHQLKNVHVRAEEYNGTVVLLHQIKEGPDDKSKGNHVDQLAELPEDLISRAQDILKELEHSGNKPEVPVQKSQIKEKPAQLSFFDEAEKPAEAPKLSKKEKQVLDAFKSLNILDMTPLEAMNEMYKLQKKLH